MSNIEFLKNELETEKEHSAFLEKLLQALYGEGWDKLTLFDAKRCEVIKTLTTQKDTKMTCKCVICDECKGSGNIWVDYKGKYLGNNRCDDMDELDTCPECDGSGLSEICYECWEESQDDESWG